MAVAKESSLPRPPDLNKNRRRKDADHSESPAERPFSILPENLLELFQLMNTDPEFIKAKAKIKRVEMNLTQVRKNLSVEALRNKQRTILIAQQNNLSSQLISLQAEKKQTPGGKIEQEIIEITLPLVKLFLYKHNWGKGKLPTEDLIQEGVIGLMNAVESYDPQRGTFISCVFWAIKHAVTRAAENTGNLIRIPSDTLKEIQRFKILKDNIEKSGIEPTEEQLAQEFGAPIERIRDLLLWQKQNFPSSLEEPLNTDAAESLTLADMISDESTQKNIDDDILRHDLLEIINNNLSEIEAQIVILYFGLNGESLKLEEIGKRKDIEYTKERVRQLLARALRRLKDVITLANPELLEN